MRGVFIFGPQLLGLIVGGEPELRILAGQKATALFGGLLRVFQANLNGDSAAGVHRAFAVVRPVDGKERTSRGGLGRFALASVLFHRLLIGSGARPLDKWRSGPRRFLGTALLWQKTAGTSIPFLPKGSAPRRKGSGMPQFVPACALSGTGRRDNFDLQNLLGFLAVGPLQPL